MNPDEYKKLWQVDQEHWFYRGKRAIVRYWIDRFIRLQSADLLVDAGMGTGTWVVEMAGQCQVIGIDDHSESLALAAPRVEAAGGRVMKSGLNRVGLPDGVATVVTLMDVLEHLPDDAGAFREMVRLTRPGGLLVVTVPALQMLWSDWDEALHHQRRYSKARLLQTLRQPGVEMLHCAYFNTALLPLIVLVRWHRRRWSAPLDAERAEDKIPSPFVNRCLYELLVRPACWKFSPAPLGVSILAVMRRTHGDTV